MDRRILKTHHALNWKYTCSARNLSSRAIRILRRSLLTTANRLAQHTSELTIWSCLDRKNYLTSQVPSLHLAAWLRHLSRRLRCALRSVKAGAGIEAARKRPPPLGKSADTPRSGSPNNRRVVLALPRHTTTRSPPQWYGLFLLKRPANNFGAEAVRFFVMEQTWRR